MSRPLSTGAHPSSIPSALTREVEPLRVGDRVRILDVPLGVGGKARVGLEADVYELDPGCPEGLTVGLDTDGDGVPWWFPADALERVARRLPLSARAQPTPTDIRHADDTIAAWLRSGTSRCVREVAGAGSSTVLYALDCSNALATSAEVTIATGEGATYPRARRDLARRLYEMRDGWARSKGERL